MTICKQCSTSIAGGDYVGCEGFCGQSFHIKCVGLSDDDLMRYRKKSDMWWICEPCILQIREIRTNRSSQTRINETNCSLPDTANAKMNCEEEIIEMKKQIAAIHESIGTATITRSEADLQSSRNMDIGTPVAHSSSSSSSRLLYGTKNAGNQSAVVNSEESNEIFWLFFTRLRNNVSERDMFKMIDDSLGPNVAAVVKRLVPPWKNVSSMPYISFKVGIDARFKGSALLPSTWPARICFREFYNHVWEPQS